MSDQKLENQVISAIEATIGKTASPVPLHEPRFSGNEWAYVRDCLNTSFVSSVGRYVDRFERMLAEYTGMRRAIAVVNGTAALHSSLVFAGVGVGDEVLVPALTFVATANAVAYTGAVPHFVDSEEKTLGLDPVKLESHLAGICKKNRNRSINRKTGRTIRAIIPMHTFGHPVDLDGLYDLCRSFSITMIEDAAEALGTLYKRRHVGNWGSMSIVSFNGNKILTTGGGGAILTNDHSVADGLKHLTTTAKRSHRWTYVHDQVAYNYRMPNLNAALGCAQIEKLPQKIEKKRRLAERYATEFNSIEGLRFFTEPDFARSNYWLNAILLDPVHHNRRDSVLEATHRSGYLTRPTWTLMHRLPMYTESPRMDLVCAESIDARLINLPSSEHL